MRGRIHVTPGVVLENQVHRETDRVAVVYTRDLGKIRARFIGVNRPKGKLKALSEPMSLGEYRIHLRDGVDVGIAAGGSLTTAFPGIRRSLIATLRGLEIVELLDRLTPLWKPNPDKFDLIEECLRTVEAGGGDWIVSAFALRLLQEAGYGMADRCVSQENRTLWDILHRAPVPELARLPEDRPRQRRLEHLIRTTVEKVTERPLHCLAMRDTLIRGVAV